MTKQQDFGLLREEAQIRVCSASEECNEIRSEKGVAVSFPRSFIISCLILEEISMRDE